ncbi:MAG: dual specificity protein phosphatase family protein [Desulfomonile sp.]
MAKVTRAVPHMTRDLEKPFARSYWVVPNKFLAGYYPGSKHAEEASQRHQGLLNCGIRYVVNLMEEHETDHSGNGFVPYENTLREIADGMAVDVYFIRHPIRDNGVPSTEQMVTILDTIDHAISSELPVYVHCWGGVGRTGTVVGCYLARHGIATGQECLVKIRELRRIDPTADRSSPETIKQADMVLGWKTGK